MAYRVAAVVIEAWVVDLAWVWVCTEEIAALEPVG